MGTYYYVYNHTKKEEVHLDGHIKKGPLLYNEAVSYAIMVYLFENKGDSFQLLPDCSPVAEAADGNYKEVNLLEYRYKTEGAIDTIIEKLNEVYGEGAYFKNDKGFGEERG